MFRHIVCHPQEALMILAKITCKTLALHSVKGVAAYHGFWCAVCSVCVCMQAHTEHTAHANP
jgi:hypothetical protein